MKTFLYADGLAVVAAFISIFALALMFDRVADPAALTYASTAPALLLPSG